VQLTLALGPTVTEQVEPLLHASEQDCPQLPMQLFLSVQVAEQLPPLQPPWDRSQLAPDGQTQLDPVQEGACAEPQPPIAHSITADNDKSIFLIIFIGSSLSATTAVSMSSDPSIDRSLAATRGVRQHLELLGS